MGDVISAGSTPASGTNLKTNKMKKNKVIPAKYYRKFYPINGSILWSFLMYYFKAPQWLWGVYLTLLLIIWVLVIISVVMQEEDESLINKK